MIQGRFSQRLSGKALRALVFAVRHSPARYALAATLRRDLGIDALRALPASFRGPLAPDTYPIAAGTRRAARRAEPVASLDLPVTGGREFTQAYRSGQIRPSEVLERVIVLEQALRSSSGGASPFLDLDVEGARRAARESDQRYAQGAPLGAWDGVPVAVKEELAVQGLPWRFGTGWMPSTPTPLDAEAVRRLRAAGSVIVGTTVMTEYGLSPLGGNVFRRMPRNVFDPGRLAGGSSTGSAVAVATELVPMAIGVDGGGSIRVPAALNALFGLKPTFGRIPLSGHGLGSGTTVVHIGPLARSSYDLASSLELMAGPDSGDRASEQAPPFETGEFVRALGRGVRGLRIGVERSEWADAAAELVAPLEAALTALERAGASIVEVRLPLARHAKAIGYLTIGPEAHAALHVPRTEHLDELGLDAQLLLAGLETLDAGAYLDAQCFRTQLRRSCRELFTEIDLLALPATATPAPPITDAEAEAGFIDPQALDAMCRYAFLGNLTGLPAGTAPVGCAGHLPVGLQLIGDAWDEACVLTALAELERQGAARSLAPPRSWTPLTRTP